MLQNHVILCGLGRVGRRVLDYLQAAGVAAVAIDTKITAAEEAASGNVRFLRGDFRDGDLLDHAGLAHARGVLLLTSDDLVNLSALMTVVHERPDVRVVVRMFNPTLVARLGDIAKNVFALSASALTAPMLALIAHTGGALAAFQLGDDRPMLITEWTLPEAHAVVGMRLDAVKETAKVDIVARGPRSGDRQFFADLRAGDVVAGGDRLIVCGPAEDVEELTGIGEADSFGRYGWSDSVRRFGRMVRKVLAEVDLPVKICTAILLVVILISVAIFRFGMRNDTLIDAFYRTISLMATGADMRGQDADPGSWQMAFISSLRLLGAALTAAFTAILTNYLVRAHLRGALEVRRIPEGGHVIVIGLGNVGFRVVQELIRLGDTAVAVERNRDNPFIATARRLGMAVIVGDATVAEVLKQAHAGAAKSIVVATENELTNLEIALLVREMHPDKRLLVRLIDPQLASLLRRAANIHLALSIPELAAPAFLAAFLGDRIRTVLLAQGQLLAVVDITVNADDSLVGKTVSEWAELYRLLPLAVTRGTEQLHGAFDNAALPAGAILTALITFRDVHKLFQRGARSPLASA
jgi:Trk K+ transport system NAD-binding subunit